MLFLSIHNLHDANTYPYSAITSFSISMLIADTIDPAYIILFEFIVDPVSVWINKRKVHLKSSRMKLQIHVRSQYRGSWVCQTHLHHFQMAIICLSCVYTCLHLWLRNKSKISIRHSKHVRTRGYMWNTRGRHLTII